MVFVDSDLLVACLRPLNSKKPAINNFRLKAREKLENLFSQFSNVKITIYNMAELYKGAYKSKRTAHNLRLVEAFLSRFEIIAPTTDSAKEFARVWADLELKGNEVGLLDQLIASIVITNHDILITHNVDHFGRIPLLNFENWGKVAEEGDSRA